MYTYERQESREDALRGAMYLVVQSPLSKEGKLRSVRIGCAVQHANEPVSAVLAAYMLDVFRKKLVPDDALEEFGAKVRNLTRRCLDMHRYYGKGEEALLKRFRYAEEDGYARSMTAIISAEAAEDLGHMHHIPEKRRGSLISWATSWHAIAERILDKDHPLSIALGWETAHAVCSAQTSALPVSINGVTPHDLHGPSASDAGY